MLFPILHPQSVSLLFHFSHFLIHNRICHSGIYFKFIFSVSIRILIEIFVFKLNKFSTLSSQYITYSIYYGCFPGIIFTNQHIYAFLKMNF